MSARTDKKAVRATSTVGINGVLLGEYNVDKLRFP